MTTSHPLHTRIGAGIGHVFDRMMTHWNPETLDDWVHTSGARTTRHTDAAALEARVLARHHEDVMLAARIDAAKAARRAAPQKPCACPACTGSTVVENP